jgi:AcrB/AcrD/AcrF family
MTQILRAPGIRRCRAKNLNRGGQEYRHCKRLRADLKVMASITVPCPLTGSPDPYRVSMGRSCVMTSSFAGRRSRLSSLVVLLFLGSGRSTLIVATSIPLSILCSIVALSWLGETINVMTLGRLALAVASWWTMRP